MTTMHIVPEAARRLRRCDADDAAESALNQARTGPNRIALFLGPDGEFFAGIVDSERCEDLLSRYPASFVGAYSRDAMKCDVIADIRVRALQIGMEWPE